MIRIRENPNETQPPLADLLPDETLSSWVARQPGRVYETSDSRSRDLDFDKVELDLPTASANLKAKLRRAATRPDPWMLPREWRTRYCPECRVVDWATGNPKYLRRSWAVAWRTCCPKHGPLVDCDRSHPEVPLREVLDHRAWGSLVIFLNRHCEPYARINITGERRAVHLESALATSEATSGYTKWFPRGLTCASLMSTYCALITALMDQLEVVPWRQSVASESSASNDDPLVAFGRLPAIRQFGINVCVEAILAEWSKTPLPAKHALARRTELIVRVLGWGCRGASSRHPDAVLFGVPRQCIMPTFGILKTSFGNANECTSVPGEPRATDSLLIWLTKQDADLLGWGWQCRSEASVIAHLARAGRLGSYDERHGRLKRTLYPIPMSEVEIDAINSRSLRLPSWCERELTLSPMMKSRQAPALI